MRRNICVKRWIQSSLNPSGQMIPNCVIENPSQLGRPNELGDGGVNVIENPLLVSNAGPDAVFSIEKFEAEPPMVNVPMVIVTDAVPTVR